MRQTDKAVAALPFVVSHQNSISWDTAGTVDNGKGGPAGQRDSVTSALMPAIVEDSTSPPESRFILDTEDLQKLVTHYIFLPIKTMHYFQIIDRLRRLGPSRSLQVDGLSLLESF